MVVIMWANDRWIWDPVENPSQNVVEQEQVMTFDHATEERKMIIGLQA
jgi:hypothetical protein